MASEQKGNRKKQSRNTLRGEHKHPVLYRHQDCIPTSKVFHECEINNKGLVSLKNNLEIESTGKLIKEDKVNNINPTSKRFNAKLKSEESHDKEDSKPLGPKVIKQQLIESESNSEELSKSRKRRLRKQKLLVSLAPASSISPVKLNTCIESNLQSKPVPQSTIRHSTVTASTTGTGTGTASVTNRLGDTGKQSLKESRKRLDKSVGSRNKSIKGKTLAESVNQTKADIIKSLEEKTLTSLLQTLVPLTNSSPKKEKPPVPLFSFNDKKLNSSDSKVGKDEVFYFGETKHQLEKLTGFSKSNTGLNKEKLETGQNTEVDKFNSFSTSSIGNLDNCVSPFNFSSVFTEQNINITSVKTNFCNVEAPQTIEESKTPFCFGADNSNQDINLKDQKPKSPVKSIGQYPAKALIFNRTPCTSSAIVTNNLPVALHKFKTDLTAEVCTENHSHNKLLSVQDELKHHLSNNIPIITELENSKVSIMESMDEKLKSNKTREEIKLEREAKKAAKLAAKAKHKTAQSSKDSSLTKLKRSDSDNKQGTEVEKKIMCVEQVSPNSVESPAGSKQHMNKLGTSNVESPSPLSVKEVVNNKEKVIPETLEEAVKGASAKSKAELRAERRAKQEAQRAAKVLPKQPQQKDKMVFQAKNEPKTDITTKPAEKRQEVSKTAVQPKPKLFSHLYQEKSPLTSKEILLSGGLHPAIVKLGVQYATRVIAGSNARCVALLNALKQMVTDYTTPSEKEFSRGLEEELGPVTVYLHQCRPLAVSMTNALRHIKRTLTQLPNNIPDVEARQKICDVVDTYIHEQVDVAGTAICNTVKDKIANGDVILTYGCSSLVYKILIQSHLSGKRFRVVVVDGLPWREGREMLRRLVDKGLSCTYVLITAASFIMREASKVLLGAHALLANGCVMSRAGSSQVALLAHCYNVPVLVCCEMHKFSERVQTDAFVYNELGVLESTKDREKIRTVASLTPLSLAYDITPPDLVSAVVTELAVLPCTSVPVILRIKPSESLM